ncbi:MAG TPA: regulatory protein RecX [Thermotogota bacterium]|nr:regulatory protein RecX [Thermotogota bacterium]HRW35768.1 regulatory protein RecX [Thermotogota bacterium]
MKGENSQNISQYCSLLFKYRPRTEEEIRKRCLEKGFDEDIVEQTIEELYTFNLLDDLRFSKMYIDDGLRLKTKGLFRLEMELSDLGVSADNIKQAIDEVDEEEIYEVLKRDFQRNSKDNPDKWQRRMYRRGFQMKRIKDVINAFKDNNFD